MFWYCRLCVGTRISTGCPSTTPVGLALGPDSPWEDELDPGTLSHPAGQILTVQFVTHACILTRTQSTTPYSIASTTTRSHASFSGNSTLPSPTPHHYGYTWCCHNFGGVLSPATLSALNHLTSELLRTLSRMAASKPTSWLSSRSYILFHLAHP